MNAPSQTSGLWAAVFSSLALSCTVMGQSRAEQQIEADRIGALRTPTLVSMDKSAKEDCGTLVLSFGDREDATLWLESFDVPRGKRGNLRRVKSAVRGPEPTLDNLVDLFGHSPNRIFFGGHSDGKTLYNRKTNIDALKISIEFKEDGVLLSHGEEQRFLAKGTEFLLHQNLQEIYWGGCSMHRDPEHVRVLTRLFANDDGALPIMFGWKSTSGWQVTNVIFGGFGNDDPFPKLDYFDRLQRGEHQVRAWLSTIHQTDWGEYTIVWRSASVIDSNGIEYVLSKDGRIVRSGRVFSESASKEHTEAAASTTMMPE